MNRSYPIRMQRRRTLRGLGYPILPDQFTTAAGVPESFSANTPDATMVAILQAQGQQLPAALAAAMAAGTASTTYVAPNQSPISNSLNVAPGVWLYTRADGTTFYGDATQNPVSYTPPAVSASGSQIPVPPALNTPPAPIPPVVTTPAATSQPTSTTPVIAVTPSGVNIDTTTGQVTTAPATLVSTAGGFIDSTMSWLEGSMIGGIPNWLLLGGAVAGLMMFSGDGGSTRRRR